MKEPKTAIKSTELYVAIVGFIIGGILVKAGWNTNMGLAGAAIIAVTVYSYISGRSRTKAAAATDVSLNPPKRII